jgi:Tol biopolymer transport system component/predicted Ser/Thr protein kinase
MSLAIGTTLGPYEILAPIGAGGMGEVWKARDTRLDRVVAVKVSKVQFSERFEREARAVAALNHPHVCQLYDVGPDYLVMEFVEGAPLKGPLPLEKAVEYAGQILDALDAAHRKGITHRDLKPANILVTKQGIKLLDFGLAKQSGPLKETDGTLTSALTGQGQILGTLQYMSPEQLNGKEADARSDLFSFGCVLYEMLTGRRAFEGHSAASVIAAILEREPAPLEVARPLDRVVRRSLAKDPDQRFQTARDLKAALAWALEQAPVTQSKPNRRMWIGIAAAMLVVGAAGGFSVARFRQPAPYDAVLRLHINPPVGGQFVIGGGLGASVALSPDGANAAFVATVNGKNALWVRPLNRTEARLIPGTVGAWFPFWSPDGKSIGFYTGFKMMRVDLAGGAPLVLCECSVVRGASWTSDGTVIFGSIGYALRRVPDSGGTPSPLTTLDDAAGEVSHYWPQALPGGRFLFFVQTNKPENTGIYAASLAKPTERIHLLTTDANALYASGPDGRGYLVWQRGGILMAQEFDVGALQLKGEVRSVADRVATSTFGLINAAVAGSVLFYSETSPVSQFTWFDPAGKRLGVVGEPGEFASFRLAPDGRRIAAFRDRPGGMDLWILDADRGIPNRFTSTPGFKSYPTWSPDGRSIVFASGATFNLFRKATTGGGDGQRLMQSSRDQVPNDWSRGGRFLLYHEIAGSRGVHMWILPMPPDGAAPSVKPRPYGQGTQFNEYYGRFSPEPDPRWVAYQSDESGRIEIYVDAFPEPRNKVQISNGGGRYPEWSPDGRELFFVSPDQKLMAVSLKAGTESLEASPPRELFTLPSPENGRNPYDVAPDGRRFLVRAVPENQAAQPLTLIVNWPALLKKGAAAQ